MFKDRHLEKIVTRNLKDDSERLTPVLLPIGIVSGIIAVTVAVAN